MKNILKKFIELFGYSFHIIKNNEIGSISFKIVKLSKQEKTLQSIEKENPFRNKDLQLLDSNKGYHYLYPPITEIQLKNYYKEHYWRKFRDTDFVGVKDRDFFHFELIKKYKLLKKDGKILNFGSGHGGISFIFSILNNQVINFDYDKSLKNFENYFQTIDDFTDLKDNSVDLIYASHSLEHVSNIDSTISEFKRIASKNCKVLFEVPNAEYLGNGLQNNKIDEPHTIYFTRKYFENILSKNILIKTYNGDYELDNFEKISNFSNKHNSLVIIGEL
jgi:2-polyprenyl-3-methyl-5-hydroxy-6-metoxy-1,4-benzoquinol methylase